jgi:hypothetical protein
MNKEGKKKKGDRNNLDTDISDNITISFSNIHVLSYQHLKILRLIDVIIEPKFFK